MLVESFEKMMISDSLFLSYSVIKCAFARVLGTARYQSICMLWPLSCLYISLVNSLAIPNRERYHILWCICFNCIHCLFSGKWGRGLATPPPSSHLYGLYEQISTQTLWLLSTVRNLQHLAFTKPNFIHYTLLSIKLNSVPLHSLAPTVYRQLALNAILASFSGQERTGKEAWCLPLVHVRITPWK